MFKSWQLLFIKTKSSLKQWQPRQVFNWLTSLIIGVAFYIFLNDKLNSMSNERQIGIFSLMLVSIGFLVVMYSTIMSYQIWFSSTDSFYFITTPLKFKEMYYFHWLDIGLRFLYIFGHLVLPGVIVFSLKLFGTTGIFAGIFIFFCLLSLSVNIGFFLMFYLLYNKERFWCLALLVLVLMSTVSGLLYLYFIDSTLFISLWVLLWALGHLGAFWYGKRVFKYCLDSANLSLNIRADGFSSQFFKKLILFNSLLKPLFRAFLFKELLTDGRNIFLLIRYLGTTLFLLTYLPLFKLPYISQGGIVSALVFSYLMVVLNFHETYSTTFAKEGNMIGFLLPATKSWSIGLAKFIAGVLQVLPLVGVAACIVTYKHGFSLTETITFAVTLWLLCAVHLASVVSIGVVALNMDFRDMGLLAGMIYEYVFGNINPSILFNYMATFTIPAVFVGLLLGVYYLNTEVISLKYIWGINFIALLLIGLALKIGEILYRKRLKQLLI